MNILHPEKNCALCPRLYDFRVQNTQKYPDYFNDAVPNFISENAVKLMIVGLAPGLHGANQTGRPFTNDYAGDLLYSTLLKHNFATGTYQKHKNDGLILNHTLITNAVKCVPPDNKPTGAEIKQCQPFLKNLIEQHKSHDLQAILCLGKIAHDAVLRCLNLTLAHYKFAHQAVHHIQNIRIYDSYHCSRYNTNTGVLTIESFDDLLCNIKKYINI
jgi:uracil-DNA glycosylase